MEAVVLREEARQHRQGLLAAVLLVRGDEHDVPALTCPLAPGEHEPARIGGDGMLGLAQGGSGQEQTQEKGGSHGR